MIYFPEGRVRFSNIEDLQLLEKERAAVEWLLKYTNLNKELLLIASTNSYMAIPISVDLIRYDKDLRAQIKNERKQRNYSTFVGTQFWETEEYKKERENDESIRLVEREGNWTFRSR